MFWFIFVCDLLIPVVMMIAGRWMRVRPPKEINGFMGYRTARSMKSMDTWNFAHEYAGKLWQRRGWILLVPSMLVHLPFYGADEDTLGVVCLAVTAVQVIVLLGSIIPVEMALKRTFDENGSRRAE